MKILFISNFYPPYFDGGYELYCKEIAEALAKKGHQYLIVTSKYGVGEPIVENNIYRVLSYELSPWDNKRNYFQFLLQEIEETIYFEKLIKNTKPDIIFIMGCNGLSKLLLLKAEESKLPVAYWIGGAWITEKLYNNGWFIFWEATSSLHKKIIKIILRIFLTILYGKKIGFKNKELKVEWAGFNSLHTKTVHEKAGFSTQRWEKIYPGVSDIFLKTSYKKKINSKLVKLLYVGRLHPQKGVDTVIQAVIYLVKELKFQNIILDIIGSGELNYENSLKNLVQTEAANEYVNFYGKKRKEDLPAIYHEHDIVVFPPRWEEPLGFIPLEAMACHVPVISTATGGSSEVLVDEVNILKFPQEDYKSLALQIKRLIEDKDLREKLIMSGKKTVEENFTFQESINKIEYFLKKVCDENHNITE